jgi:hypothetical protein
MTPHEASRILGTAKWVMLDMGMTIEAGEAEDAELFLLRNPTPEEARTYADFVLPKGRRGRVKLLLCRPEQARAIAFIAAVLRTVE